MLIIYRLKVEHSTFDIKHKGVLQMAVRFKKGIDWDYYGVDILKYEYLEPKYCPKKNRDSFINTDELKNDYYRGISEWNNLKGFLTDKCLTVQDEFKCVLDRFEMMTN